MGEFNASFSAELDGMFERLVEKVRYSRAVD